MTNDIQVHEVPLAPGAKVRHAMRPPCDDPSLADWRGVIEKNRAGNWRRSRWADLPEVWVRWTAGTDGEGKPMADGKPGWFPVDQLVPDPPGLPDGEVHDPRCQCDACAHAKCEGILAGAIDKTAHAVLGGPLAHSLTQAAPETGQSIARTCPHGVTYWIVPDGGRFPDVIALVIRVNPDGAALLCPEGALRHDLRLCEHGAELAARAVRCVCGYGPTTERDLDQHILASMHLPGDHAEAH